MRQKVFIVALIGLVAGMSVGWYYSVRPDQEAFTGSSTGLLWPDPRPLPEFQLSDHDGEKFDRNRLQGHWTLMFFGYTSCPDICPTTMNTLRSVTLALDKYRSVAPDMVLVTVDPDRDDATTLAEYVSHFDKAFIGVRGAEDELHLLTLKIGAMYQLDEPDDRGNYDVAHSASLFLVDPQARLHAVFSPPHKAADIAKRLTAIRLQYEQS